MGENSGGGVILFSRVEKGVSCDGKIMPHENARLRAYGRFVTSALPSTT